MPSLLMNKWFWVAVVLLATNAWTGWTAYDYAEKAGQVALLEEKNATLERDKAILIEIAKKREEKLRELIRKMNEAARENAEQKAIDDKLLREYLEKIEELSNEVDDTQCLDPDTTDKLRW